MSNSSDVARIVADTDALLFWGNSDYLCDIATNIHITTTNACLVEVTRHSNSGGSHLGTAGLDADERRRQEGASNILPFLTGSSSLPQGVSADDVTINTKFCGVPGLQHDSDGGEESIAELLRGFANSVEFVAMMDSGANNQGFSRGGRDLVKNSVPNWDSQGISFVSPAPILALLAVEGLLTSSQVCSDLDCLIREEKWPNAAWRNVPLDCSEGPSFLPDLGVFSD